MELTIRLALGTLHTRSGALEYDGAGQAFLSWLIESKSLQLGRSGVIGYATGSGMTSSIGKPDRQGVRNSGLGALRRERFRQPTHMVSLALVPPLMATGRELAPTCEKRQERT
jgi:hypothetical protein